MFLFIVYRCQKQVLTGQNLNTSHVLIYLTVSTGGQKMPYNLNTSHVLIYLDTSSDVAAEVFYLNTSHVLIYQR